jgi:hypothetical protein
MFQSAAIAPLTRELEEQNGTTRLFMTKTVLTSMPRPTQLIIQESVTMAVRYDSHTVSLIMNGFLDRLASKLAFVYSVTTEVAMRVLLSVPTTRGGSVNVQKSLRKVAHAIKAKLFAQVGDTSKEFSPMVNMLPVAIALKFINEKASSQDIRSWFQKWVSESRLIRIYIFPGFPSGEPFSTCEHCGFDLSGLKPSLYVKDATSSSKEKGSTLVIGSCPGVNHPRLHDIKKRKMQCFFPMNTVRSNPVFMAYYVLCCKIKGVLVPDPPPEVQIGSSSSISASLLKAFKPRARSKEAKKSKSQVL